MPSGTQRQFWKRAEYPPAPRIELLHVQTLQNVAMEWLALLFCTRKVPVSDIGNMRRFLLLHSRPTPLTWLDTGAAKKRSIIKTTVIDYLPLYFT